MEKLWHKCREVDVFNGLLPAPLPHLDATFDRGYIAFGDEGKLIVSNQLGTNDLKTLGIDELENLNGLSPANFKCLAWHRTNEFKGV